jgi:3-oxoacyl-[acyl-carrier-protein] synthase II
MRPQESYFATKTAVFEFSNHNRSEDVLVTGMGLVTPLGCCADETWDALIANRRAGRCLTPPDIDHFDQLSAVDNLALHGAVVDHSEVDRRLELSELLGSVPGEIADVWRSEPLVAMSLVALDEAMAGAGLYFKGLLPERTAVVFGSSKGGLRSTERMTEAMRYRREHLPQMANVGNSARDTERDDLSCSDDRSAFLDHWNHAAQTNSATRAITELTRAGVASSCPVAACATGLVAVLQGAAMIHRGECDVCIVGSADAGLRSSVLASFHRLRVTSRSADAASACRPFDKSRDGFLVGEGAGVMILESRAHAESRRANSIAKVVAGGWLSDPTGMTQIDESGTVVSEVLKRVLTSKHRRLDILSVHGTGTESNDLAEARGIQTAFAASQRIPECFGVKGAIGHLLGAAGSVETVLTLLALHHQKIPGTANLRNIDNRCRIPLHSQVRTMPHMQQAAKLSLGFGGHVACGVFERQ